MAAIPLPPKKTIEEHVATQAEFRETTLEPLLEEARAGKGHVFFVDAAHFVMGAFLCCVWCLAAYIHSRWFGPQALQCVWGPGMR